MGKRQGEQLQVDKTPLMNLPIRLPSDQQENVLKEEIVQAVEGIISIKEHMKSVKLVNELDVLERKVLSLQNAIDARVYSIYNIKDTEIAIIENGF